MLNPSFVHGLGKVLFALLFWCRLHLLSVSAHPACGVHVGNYEGPGNTMSPFVQWILLPASAARRFAWHRYPCLLALGLPRWPLTQACQGVEPTRYQSVTWII